MSLFGHRETGIDDSFISEAGMSNGTFSNENHCQRFWNRLLTCVRESQEVDVLYDCRSRMLDMRECTLKHKQSIWVFRETIATIRNEKAFREWLRKYDEEFGHPPLLESVRRVRAKVEKDGGLKVIDPTVFHDPDIFVPRKEYPKP